MGLLYRRAGCLTAKNDGFRPGQYTKQGRGASAPVQDFHGLGVEACADKCDDNPDCAMFALGPDDPATCQVRAVSLRLMILFCRIVCMEGYMVG